jgi:hypothetical protein
VVKKRKREEDYQQKQKINISYSVLYHVEQKNMSLDTQLNIDVVLEKEQGLGQIKKHC